MWLSKIPVASARLLCGVWLAASGAMLSQVGTAQAVPGAPGPSAAGQNVTTLTEPPAPLLPTTDRLAASDASGAVPADKPEVAAILKECGLKRADSRVVLSAGGSTPSGYVKAYQFVDATGALSAYTYFRQNGKLRRDAAEGVTEAELPDGELVVLDGVSVVRAKADRASLDPILTAIEVGLPKVNGRRGLPPLLPSLFPKGEMQGSTLEYALGPVTYRSMGGVLPAELLAWEKSAEVATSRYADKAGSGTLTLLMYPTPEIAGDRGRVIQALIAANTQADLRSAKLRRIGPLLAMTSGRFGAAQADTLLQSVHLNQEVILDKAMPSEFHVEIRKTATLLEQIAVFVGVGILAALVFGVFFGGGRAAIRVMQGKPAWVDPEFLHIDLRGRPEPLKPSRGSDD